MLNNSNPDGGVVDMELLSLTNYIIRPFVDKFEIEEGFAGENYSLTVTEGGLHIVRCKDRDYIFVEVLYENALHIKRRPIAVDEALAILEKTGFDRMRSLLNEIGETELDKQLQEAVLILISHGRNEAQVVKEPAPHLSDQFIH